jgi:DNA-binding GntR family transcriptional regulator
LTVSAKTAERNATSARGGAGSVCDALRRVILSGELEEGMPLSQVTLAERFGVSRTPMREALRTLQVEGLIELLPNGRMRVSSFSMSDLESLYAMRVSLESMAVAVGARRLPQAAFERLDELLIELAPEQSVDRWQPIHRELHALLVSAVAEPLAGTIRRLQDNSERYRRLYSTQESAIWQPMAAAEHQAIVDALRAGDGPAAASELARHLARTALTLLASRDPLYEPVVLRTAVSLAVSPHVPPSAPDGRIRDEFSPPRR